MPDYRVSQGEVKEIIDTEVDDILPFIAVADTIVTDQLTGQGYSTEMLKELTRWLAAHFVAIRDPRTKRAKTGDAEAEFVQGKVGEGLAATPYGQQVLAMDVSGVLAEMSVPRREASVETII